MTVTEEIMQAALAAPEDRKREALMVLRGEAAGKRGAGRGNGRVEVEAYVNLGVVTEFLGVSRRSVWRWQVPCHRLGTRTRFRLSEVAAYMESAAYRKRLAELKSGAAEKGRCVMGP